MTPCPRPYATPRWWADAARLAAGLSLLVVIALCVANRGGQAARWRRRAPTSTR
jgi:hypothetical protein